MASFGHDDARPRYDTDTARLSISERASGIHHASNLVEHSASGRFAMDDQGRTRFEFGDQVAITDPVQGVRWMADERSGRTFRSILAESTGRTQRRADSGDGAPDARLPEAPLDARHVLDLGTAMQNGLECTGTLYRQTIPSGTMGNVEPIVIETEVWQSDAYGFGLPVRTVVRNPLMGDSSQELRNIRSLTDAEAEDLFRPDGDWTVVEGSAPATLGSVVPDAIWR